jgi:hypothetical protein
VRSILTSSSALKNDQFSYRKRKGKLIYTDERKEEDLSSQAIDEESRQLSTEQDQFTGDNDEDEEIESKLNMITGSSQMYNKSSESKILSRRKQSNQNEMIQETPMNDQ